MVMQSKRSWLVCGECAMHEADCAAIMLLHKIQFDLDSQTFHAEYITRFCLPEGHCITSNNLSLKAHAHLAYDLLMHIDNCMALQNAC